MAVELPFYGVCDHAKQVQVRFDDRINVRMLRGTCPDAKPLALQIPPLASMPASVAAHVRHLQLLGASDKMAETPLGEIPKLKRVTVTSRADTKIEENNSDIPRPLASAALIPKPLAPRRSQLCAGPSDVSSAWYQPGGSRGPP